MSGMEEFLEMGGHGAYIWPAYGLVFVVLAALFIFSHRFAGNAGREFDALNPRTRKNQDSADET